MSGNDASILADIFFRQGFRKRARAWLKSALRRDRFQRMFKQTEGFQRSVINQHENSEFEKNCNNSIRVALINKLRKFKLSDEQISEVLELPLGIVKQIDYED